MAVIEGAKAIAIVLNTTPKRVRQLAKQGAPVRVVGSGRGARYLADQETVVRWIKCEPKSKP